MFQVLTAIARSPHYTIDMDNPSPADIQQAIQNSLQEIAAQMGQSLNASATEQLYADAAALISHISYEPLTLAHVAGTLLVFQVQKAETEEVEWFRSQV
jgi:hypothetical protein